MNIFSIKYTLLRYGIYRKIMWIMWDNHDASLTKSNIPYQNLVTLYLSLYTCIIKQKHTLLCTRSVISKCHSKYRYKCTYRYQCMSFLNVGKTKPSRHNVVHLSCCIIMLTFIDLFQSPSESKTAQKTSVFIR